MERRVFRGGEQGRWFSDDARHAAHFGTVSTATLRWDAADEAVVITEASHPDLYSLGTGEDADAIQDILDETGAALAILVGWEGAGDCYYVGSDWVITD